MPSRAIVSSVAYISGVSNRLARATLTRYAEAARRARPLAHDRPHDGEGDPDPHAAKDLRQRGGDLERPQDLGPAGPKAPPQLEQAAVDGPDADHRRDGDREEDDQGTDHDLAGEPGPNQMRSSGARARIGVAWAATRYGDSTRAASADRAST